MGVLEDLGVCRQSGCEALAIGTDTGFLIIGRPDLFRGIELANYAVENSQTLRNMMDRFVSSVADLGYLQFLADILDPNLRQSLSKEALIEFFASRYRSSVLAFELPRIEVSETEFKSAVREPTAVEDSLVDRMLLVLNRAIEHYLSAEFVAKIKDLISPENILITAATFVGIAVVSASGIGTGILTAVGFALKGFEFFDILRNLLRFFETFMVGDNENAARILGGSMAALGVAVIGVFLRGVGGKIRRPRVDTRRPSSPSFSDVSRDLGLEAPRAAAPGRTTYQSRINGAVADAQAAGFIDAAGNPVKVDLAVQPHRRAPNVRPATGHTGDTRQSAHIGATSLLKTIPGYSRNDAITVLMDPKTHTSFDHHWEDWVRKQRKGGTSTATLNEIFNAQKAAIEQMNGMTNRQKDVLVSMLFQEIATLASGVTGGMSATVPLPKIR